MTSEHKDVQEKVNALISCGLTPQEIAERMDNRVSPRTIYRWAKGESMPGNQSDVDALFAIYTKAGEVS